MNTFVSRMVLIVSLGGFTYWAAPASAQTTNAARIIEIQGTVEIIRHGSAIGVTTTDTNQPPLQAFDRLRTGPNSRAALFVPGSGPVPLGPQTEVEIQPQIQGSGGLFIFSGILSFIHRGEPGRIKILSRGGNAGMKGTEFVMEVAQIEGAERTTISVIDGIVSFTNQLGSLTLTNGDQAVAVPGQAPRRTAGFNATNLLQWCFYYPAVLDLKDLSLTTEEENSLSDSLAAYRSGGLLQALDKYPATRKPGSDAERIYHAALLLSVGQVEKCEAALATLTGAEPSEKNARLANALRTLIAAVKRAPRPSTLNSPLSTPTELLAASYYEQSMAGPNSLKAALELAQRAVANSPEFGFGWERVAELEFSFGRTGRALEALNKSLALATNNAQALALKGFLLAAQNKTREAIEWFDHALVVDSALGNAWLGRGLCRIRRGDLRGGREDLLIAAALEPQRAALRSYLGKAWSDSGDDKHAIRELQIARTLDINDPTSWLYSALNNEQHNRINDAIRDLEQSLELNNNRSVYRSGILLDQDRAVRSANLARIYDEAGLGDVGVREAARGVAADYISFSSHQFLANSYARQNSLADSNLRYETAAGSEFLLTSLLAPAGATALSQRVSQQEYSHLFERNRLGLSSAMGYDSRGNWQESGSQFGTFDGFSYSLDADYSLIHGDQLVLPQESRILSLTIKKDFGLQTSLYLHVRHSDNYGGNVFQSYSSPLSSRDVHFTEKQEPILIAGLHREWSPESHSLLLFSWLTDTFKFRDPNEQTFAIFKVGGVTTTAHDFTMRGFNANSLDIFSLEAQHIYEAGPHRLILGARVQWGSFNTSAMLTNVPFVLEPYFFDLGTGSELPLKWNSRSRFNRYTGYAYYQCSLTEHLKTEVGLTYDQLREPADFRYAPLSADENNLSRFSPKAGITWQPAPRTDVQLAYTRSLGGVTFDQSFQLEPSQVVGINQLYRSLIPDAVAGANSGARFDTLGFVIDYHSTCQTYLALSGDWLRSTVNRNRGVFLFQNGFGPFNALTRERLGYDEKSLQLSVRQLFGNEWSAGLSYQLSRARLYDDFTDIPSGLVNNTGTQLIPRTSQTATLNSFLWFVNYQHLRGWFAQLNGRWLGQIDQAAAGHGPPNDFWQFDAFAGYRHRNGRFQASLGVLNLSDQNYRLNPLNIYSPLKQRRTLVASLKLDF